MEGDHVQEINSINNQIAKMKADHELFVQNLEASYNQKLIVEYKKYMRYLNIISFPTVSSNWSLKIWRKDEQST